MAGTTLRLLPLQQLTTQNNLPAATTAIVYSARKIDTSRYKSAVIVARLHAVTWTAASGVQVQIDAGPDGYTDEDPGLIWSMPGAGTIVTFTQGTDTPPVVRSGSIEGTLNHLPAPLIVRVKFVTPGAGPAATVTPTLSIDLVLREN